MMACGQAVHFGRIWSVGPKYKWLWRPGIKEEQVKHWSPFTMWVNWHWGEDNFPRDQFSIECISWNLALRDGVTGTLSHEFLALVGLQIFHDSRRDDFFDIHRTYRLRLLNWCDTGDIASESVVRAGGYHLICCCLVNVAAPVTGPGVAIARHYASCLAFPCPPSHAVVSILHGRVDAVVPCQSLARWHCTPPISCWPHN